MIKKSLDTNLIMAIVFITFLVVGLFRSESFKVIGDIYEQSGDDFSMELLEEKYAEKLWIQKDLINLNGTMLRKLRMRGVYSDSGLYVTDGNYVITNSDYTTTDYEVEQTVALRDFLEENNINLLYVSKPTKYTNDSIFRDNFGVETYSNRNTDIFIQRIRAEGIHAIDLRENMADENMDVRGMFYRTDHHWTTESGLWAAGIMAAGLNECCGYDIDLNLYDRSRFREKCWQDSWLGEQGRKLGEAYVGFDDFTELRPNFDTSFIFKNPDETTYDGDFGGFIFDEMHDTSIEENRYSSWHYSYKRIDCINQNVDSGKVLIVGDSYDHVVEPFLVLGLHETDTLILRDFDPEFSVRDYILENGYDTVIVSYAQFMIGAHDDEYSANYRMFDFH